MSGARALLAGALFLLIAVVWFLLPGGSGDGRTGSVASREPDGRRALRALLEELDHDTVVWSDAPGELPAGLGLLWLASVPTLSTRDEGPPAGDLHDPEHYRRFCADGGTLLLPAQAAQEFLVEDLGLAVFAGLDLALVDGAAARASLLGGRAWEVDLGGELVFDPTDLPRDLEHLVTLDDGHLLAVEGAVGRGRVVVLAGDPALLSNQGLAEADHAPLAVELARHLARGGPVLFDEYAAGAWRPPSAARLALGPRLAGLSAGLVLWLLLATWRRAWPGPFPREDDALLALSPLTRARARAALLERARRHDLAGAALVEGVLAHLARRARLQRGAAPPEARLEALARRAGRPGLAHAWRAALLERPARRAADLDALARSLREVELAVFPPTPDPPA